MDEKQKSDVPLTPVHRPFRVLALGLPRTGTLSMAKALEQLGLEDVYHGMYKSSMANWTAISDACDATFPSLPTYRGGDGGGKDFNWDHPDLFGPCDAVTDVGALLARPLLEAYPGTKVILVRRDFDAWRRSMDTLCAILYNPVAALMDGWIEPFLGSPPAMRVSRKMLRGWTGAHGVGDVKARFRSCYDEHHRLVEEMVPEHLLLRYRMGDGWEPLCSFLDVPVPDGPFPRTNESQELMRIWKEGSRKQMATFAWAVSLYVLPVLAVGVAGWIYYARSI